MTMNNTDSTDKPKHWPSPPAAGSDMLGEIFRLRAALLLYHEAWNGCERDWHKAMRKASRNADRVLYPNTQAEP
jgi:hypothetical protein